MARPRKISDDDVLSGAMAVFRRDGFEAASLSALEQAAGLNRRGLADRFGGKQGLFVETLGRYAAACEAAYFTPLRLPPEAPGAGMAAIRACFDAVLADGLASAGPMGRGEGCMMVEASREAVAAAPEVRAAIDRYFAMMQGALAAALSAAAARGELAAEDPAAENLAAGDLAALRDFLSGTMIGMQTMLRAGVPEPVLRNHLRLALDRVARDPG